MAADRAAPRMLVAGAGHVLGLAYRELAMRTSTAESLPLGPGSQKEEAGLKRVAVL